MLQTKVHTDPRGKICFTLFEMRIDTTKRFSHTDPREKICLIIYEMRNATT